MKTTLLLLALVLSGCAVQPRVVVLRTYLMPSVESVVVAGVASVRTNQMKCFVLGYRSGTNEVEITTVTK